MDGRNHSSHSRCPLSTGKSSFTNHTLLLQYLLNCITYFNFYYRNFHPLQCHMLMPMADIWQSWENILLHFNGLWPSLTLVLTTDPLFDLGTSFWPTVISSKKFRFILDLTTKSGRWLSEGKKIGKTVTLINFCNISFHFQTISCIFHHNYPTIN